MKKTILLVALVITAGFLTACGGVNLSGGGIAGKYVNDVLPKGAAIWHLTINEGGDHSEIIPGTENTTRVDSISRKWNGSVPCGDINAVVAERTRKGGYAIRLPLVGDKYGGKYYPPVPGGGGRFWNNPALIIGESKFVTNAEGYADWHLAHYTAADVQRIADHCGVEARGFAKVSQSDDSEQKPLLIAEAAKPQVITSTIAIVPPPITIATEGTAITITNAPTFSISAITTTAESALPDDDSINPWLLGGAALAGIGIAAVAGGGGGGDSPAAPNTNTNPPAPGTRFEITAPELGAWDIIDDDGSFWFIVSWVPVQGTNFAVLGQNVNIQRQRVTRLNAPAIRDLPETIPASWHDSGGLRVVVRGGVTVLLADGQGQVIVGTRPDITRLEQLCLARWLGDYINLQDFGGTRICNYPSNTLYSPDMRHVVYAAMADGFNSGFSFGESGFAFSGRYDGENRAAGFTYDFDTFALRTDYIRLPSKQDAEVWLDTYRFGIIRPINDEARFFAGVDSYRNAMLALDVNGDNLHRFGIAAGEGYAVKYELRIRL